MVQDLLLASDICIYVVRSVGGFVHGCNFYMCSKLMVVEGTGTKTT